LLNLFSFEPLTDHCFSFFFYRVFRKNSQQIVENLRSFRIRRIQGVTVTEKISQMGATEIAIIALSSVIFLGTVLAIALLCSSCKERLVCLF